MERTESLPIPNLGTDRNVNIFRDFFRPKRTSLSEIAKEISLLGEKNLTSVIDMDGVFVNMEEEIIAMIMFLDY